MIWTQVHRLKRSNNIPAIGPIIDDNENGKEVFLLLGVNTNMYASAD